MKEMTPSAVRERLVEHSALIVPVGTTEQHGPHLPLGCDTIIVERLADDLSARSGIMRAPTVEYGVHTLHRTMNELIESWEEGANVQQFLILTAQNNDAHQEALSTIRADQASVVAVDVFAMDFSTVIERPGGPVHGGELDTSLMLYIAPDLVHMELAQDFALPPGRGSRRFDPALGRELPAGSPGSVGYPSLASAQKGERVYSLILERVSRCLVQC